MLSFLVTLLIGVNAAAPSVDLLRSAVDPNPALQSYTAAASLSAELHAVIPVRRTFVGTAYYRKPNQKIVFDNVTGPLRRFQELSSSLPPFEELVKQYSITAVSGNGVASTFALTPTREGRVTSVTLRVDDRETLIARAVWAYTDGSRLTVDVTYTTVGNYRLPVEEHIAARFPAYRVDGVLRFSNFRFTS